MILDIGGSWEAVISDEFEKEYFKNLTAFVDSEYQNNLVYPPMNKIFNAFKLTPFESVKVVILGQDPYHGEGQANGLSFSVDEGVKFPPSLRNIFKSLDKDLAIDMPMSGSLERWAEQGVLLLNDTLTVRAATPCSHQKKGWEQFTDSVISALSLRREGIVFMLWGSHAQKKGVTIDSSKHLVLKSVHPSPLSARRGFFDCKHFSICNDYLAARGAEQIYW